jgi:hypothetical protein
VKGAIASTLRPLLAVVQSTQSRHVPFALRAEGQTATETVVRLRIEWPQTLPVGTKAVFTLP